MYKSTAYSIAVALWVATGCVGSDDPSGDTAEPGPSMTDNDGDGVAAEDDCDDGDALLGDVAEDADCDGALSDDDCDDGDALLGDIAEDADCDGALTDDDCNDADASIYPGADEYCDDIDNNCDGDIDEESSVDAPSWHTDVDGDGYGDPDDYVSSCTEVSGYLADGSDNCPDIANADQADLDADAIGDSCDTDIDGDGYEAAVDDCDDWDAAINPGATEVCDEADNDCDELVDDDDDSVDASTAFWYADSDLDGYGDASWVSSTQSCSTPDPEADSGTSTPAAYIDGQTPNSDTISLAGCGTIASITVDVDYTTDTRGYLQIFLTSPDGSIVLLKGYEYNWDDDWVGTYSDDGSDLIPDEPLSTFLGESSAGDWTLDSDYGFESYDATLNSWSVDVVCAEWVDDDSDCDDTDSTVWGPTDWHTDADGDGYGDATTATAACDSPSGMIADGTDCDDTDATVGGPETYYADTDGDGYGDTSTSTTDCTAAPSGYTSGYADCDDADAGVGMADPYYDVDGASATGEAAFTGSTEGMGNDYEYDHIAENCTLYGRDAEDVAILWTAPESTTYAFDFYWSDFDTSVAILDGCDESELTCSGDFYGRDANWTSCMEYTVTAGMTYVIVVDAFDSSTSGDYQVDIWDTAIEGPVCP